MNGLCKQINYCTKDKSTLISQFITDCFNPIFQVLFVLVDLRKRVKSANQ